MVHQFQLRSWLGVIAVALFLTAAGMPAYACSDVDADGVCDPTDNCPASETVVEYGTAMRYLANLSDPGVGLAWTQPFFDDSSWSTGSYGVGYEIGTGAENLLQTHVPPGTYSVYTRATFVVPDVASVERVVVGADFDDGFVYWINGVEVYRSATMPPGSPAWNTDAQPHESSNGAVPNYAPLADVTATAIPALADGINVFAAGVWNNEAPVSSDLVLVPLLVLESGSCDNCPSVSNPTQTDDDSDGLGNHCDCAPNDANGGLPAEVTSVIAARFEGDSTSFDWDPVIQADRYDVVRRELADEGSLICLTSTDPDTTDTVYTETASPAPGSGWLYDIRAVDDGCGGAGPWGSAAGTVCP